MGSMEEDKRKKIMRESFRVSLLMAKSYITQRNIQKQPPEVLYRKGVFKNLAKFTGKHLCCYPHACNYIKNETPTQVFSCELCYAFKTTFLQNISGRLLLTIKQMVTIYSYFESIAIAALPDCLTVYHLFKEH